MTLSKDDLSTFTRDALSFAAAAREQTLPRFRQSISIDNKKQAEAGNAFDPVTQADREAERIIRERIEAAWPDHGILGEEFGETQAGSPLRWVLDPVDGTRAFICGVASWTTLIALEHEGRPVIGVIDQPAMGETYAGGIFENGEAGAVMIRDGRFVPIKVSGETDLAKARLSTTDPRIGECFDQTEATVFAGIAEEVRVTRFGLDACAYALLAAGHLDLVIEAGLQRYDAAALIPVIEQAGGIVTDWRGAPVGPDWDKPLEEGGQRGRLVAASSPALHAAALERLSAI